MKFSNTIITLGRFKKISVIAIAVVAVIRIAIAVVDIASPHPTPATTTKVEPGQTITKAQIEQNNQQPGNNSGPQSTGSDSNGAHSEPTTAQFYDAIARANRIAPDAQGHTQFGISETRQPLPGWFVVTITNSDVGRAYVIFRQTDDPNNPLTIAAGPGTSFPPEYVSLPDAVRKVLP